MAELKPEQLLSQRTRNNLAKHLLMKRVEHAYEAGWPDLLVLAPRTQRVTFTEHKVAAWARREDGRIQFNHAPTIDQINWHLEWASGGGSSIYLIGIGLRLFAVPGEIGEKVRALTRSMIVPYEVDYTTLRKLYEEGITK